MKVLNLKIDVCQECPYYDDLELEGHEPWCLKSQREVHGFTPADWCVLEDSDGN